MVGCAVRSCRRRQYKGSGIHFFSFPTDPVQRQAWMIKTAHFNPTTHSRVCSIHFEDNSFEKDPAVLRSIDWKLDRPKIKADAIPTIKLEGSENFLEDFESNGKDRSSARPTDQEVARMGNGKKVPMQKERSARIQKAKNKKCQVSNLNTLRFS